jgi:hypothetical protein
MPTVLRDIHPNMIAVLFRKRTKPKQKPQDFLLLLQDFFLITYAMSHVISYVSLALIQS